MRSSLRHALLAVMTAVLLAFGLASPTPAMAAVPLEYSTDGVTWSATPTPLFDGTWAPVPGASESGVLQVRSSRSAPLIVAVYLGEVSSASPEVLTATTVSIDGVTIPTVAGGCALAVPQLVLRPGDVLMVPVDIEISGSLTGGQNAFLAVDVLIAASDTGPTVMSNGCPVDPAIVAAFARDSLGSTGATVAWWPFAAASVLMIVGAWFLLVRRRAARQ